MHDGDYIKPLPLVTRLNRPFWDGGRRGELRIQRCGDCHEHRFPPAPVCPHCLSLIYEWAVASGRATLWSWIVLHKLYIESFASDLPYNVAMVQLAEGPFMIASIVTLHDGLVCDAELDVFFDEITPELALPKFKLATGNGL